VGFDVIAAQRLAEHARFMLSDDHDSEAIVFAAPER
jgi:hypothetical protein